MLCKSANRKAGAEVCILALAKDTEYLIYLCKA